MRLTMLELLTEGGLTQSEILKSIPHIDRNNPRKGFSFDVTNTKHKTLNEHSRNIFVSMVSYALLQWIQRGEVPFLNVCTMSAIKRSFFGVHPATI